MSHKIRRASAVRALEKEALQPFFVDDALSAMEHLDEIIEVIMSCNTLGLSSYEYICVIDFVPVVMVTLPGLLNLDENNNNNNNNNNSNHIKNDYQRIIRIVNGLVGMLEISMMHGTRIINQFAAVDGYQVLSRLAVSFLKIQHLQDDGKLSREIFVNLLKLLYININPTGGTGDLLVIDEDLDYLPNSDQYDTFMKTYILDSSSSSNPARNSLAFQAMVNMVVESRLVTINTRKRDDFQLYVIEVILGILRNDKLSFRSLMVSRPLIPLLKFFAEYSFIVQQEICSHLTSLCIGHLIAPRPEFSTIAAGLLSSLRMLTYNHGNNDRGNFRIDKLVESIRYLVVSTVQADENYAEVWCESTMLNAIVKTVTESATNMKRISTDLNINYSNNGESSSKNNNDNDDNDDNNNDDDDNDNNDDENRSSSSICDYVILYGIDIIMYLIRGNVNYVKSFVNSYGIDLFNILFTGKYYCQGILLWSFVVREISAIFIKDSISSSDEISIQYRGLINVLLDAIKGEWPLNLVDDSNDDKDDNNEILNGKLYNQKLKSMRLLAALESLLISPYTKRETVLLFTLEEIMPKDFRTETEMTYRIIRTYDEISKYPASRSLSLSKYARLQVAFIYGDGLTILGGIVKSFLQFVETGLLNIDLGKTGTALNEMLLNHERKIVMVNKDDDINKWCAQYLTYIFYIFVETLSGTGYMFQNLRNWKDGFDILVYDGYSHFSTFLVDLFNGLGSDNDKFFYVKNESTSALLETILKFLLFYGVNETNSLAINKIFDDSLTLQFTKINESESAILNDPLIFILILETFANYPVTFAMCDDIESIIDSVCRYYINRVFICERNIEMALDAGIVKTLLWCLTRTISSFKIIENTLIELLIIFASRRVTSEELKSWVALLLNENNIIDSKRNKRRIRLLQILVQSSYGFSTQEAFNNYLTTDYGDIHTSAPLVHFGSSDAIPFAILTIEDINFNSTNNNRLTMGSGSGNKLDDKNMKTWPPMKGYTFSTWIKINSKGEKVSKVSKGFLNLITMEKENKNLFNVAILDGIIYLGKFTEHGTDGSISCNSLPLLKTDKWYHIVISVSNNPKIKTSTAVININGSENRQEIVLNNPVESIPLDDIGYSFGSPSSFSGHSLYDWMIGATFMFDEAFKEDTIDILFAVGPCMSLATLFGQDGKGQVDIVQDLCSPNLLRRLMGIRNTFSETLTVSQNEIKKNFINIKNKATSVGRKVAAKRDSLIGSEESSSSSNNNNNNSSSTTTTVEGQYIFPTTKIEEIANSHSPTVSLNLGINAQQVVFSLSSREFSPYSSYLDHIIIHIDGGKHLVEGKLFGKATAIVRKRVGDRVTFLCESGLVSFLMIAGKASNSEELRLSLELILAIIHAHPRNLHWMEKIHGYSALAYILGCKAEMKLITKEIVYVLIAFVGKSYHYSPEGKYLFSNMAGFNLLAFQYFILSFELWNKSNEEIHNLLLKYLRNAISNSGSLKQKEIREMEEFNVQRFHSAGIVDRLITFLLEANIQASLISKICDFLLLYFTRNIEALHDLSSLTNLIKITFSNRYFKSCHDDALTSITCVSDVDMSTGTWVFLPIDKGNSFRSRTRMLRHCLLRLLVKIAEHYLAECDKAAISKIVDITELSLLLQIIFVFINESKDRSKHFEAVSLLNDIKINEENTSTKIRSDPVAGVLCFTFLSSMFPYYYKNMNRTGVLEDLQILFPGLLNSILDVFSMDLSPDLWKQLPDEMAEFVGFFLRAFDPSHIFHHVGQKYTIFNDPLFRISKHTSSSAGFQMMRAMYLNMFGMYFGSFDAFLALYNVMLSSALQSNTDASSYSRKVETILSTSASLYPELLPVIFKTIGLLAGCSISFQKRIEEDQPNGIEITNRLCAIEAANSVTKSAMTFLLFYYDTSVGFRELWIGNNNLGNYSTIGKVPPVGEMMYNISSMLYLSLCANIKGFINDGKEGEVKEFEYYQRDLKLNTSCRLCLNFLIKICVDRLINSSKGVSMLESVLDSSPPSMCKDFIEASPQRLDIVRITFRSIILHKVAERIKHILITRLERESLPSNHKLFSNLQGFVNTVGKMAYLVEIYYPISTFGDVENEAKDHRFFWITYSVKYLIELLEYGFEGPINDALGNRTGDSSRRSSGRFSLGKVFTALAKPKDNLEEWLSSAVDMVRKLILFIFSLSGRSAQSIILFGCSIVKEKIGILFPYVPASATRSIVAQDKQFAASLSYFLYPLLFDDMKEKYKAGLLAWSALLMSPSRQKLLESIMTVTVKKLNAQGQEVIREINLLKITGNRRGGFELLTNINLTMMHNSQEISDEFMESISPEMEFQSFLGSLDEDVRTELETALQNSSSDMRNEVDKSRRDSLGYFQNIAANFNKSKLERDINRQFWRRVNIRRREILSTQSLYVQKEIRERQDRSDHKKFGGRHCDEMISKLMDGLSLESIYISNLDLEDYQYFKDEIKFEGENLEVRKLLLESHDSEIDQIGHGIGKGDWSLNFSEGPYRMRKKLERSFIKLSLMSREDFIPYPEQEDIILERSISPEFRENQIDNTNSEENSEIDRDTELDFDIEIDDSRNGDDTEGEGEEKEKEKDGDFNPLKSIFETRDTIIKAVQEQGEKSLDIIDSMIENPKNLVTLAQAEEDEEDEDDDDEEDEDEDPTNQKNKKEIAAVDRKLTPLLLPGDQIEEIYNCERVQGMDSYPGILLLCANNFYIIDNYRMKILDETEKSKRGKKKLKYFDYDIVEIGAPGEIMNATDYDNFNKKFWAKSRDLFVHKLHSSFQSTNSTMHTGASHSCRQWPYADVTGVHRRRYLLRHVGLEIFLSNGENSLIVLDNPDERDKIGSALLKFCSNFRKQIGAVSGPGGSKGFVLDELTTLFNFTDIGAITTQWSKGEMTNFEYLMHLNTFAGRSYNDLTQYPVFPWVLCDYHSEELDLTNPQIYRDLTKPMGALSEDREEEFRERYQLLEEQYETDSVPYPPFHYGTHYSSPGIVLHYLVRLQPYAEQSLRLQDGKFDHPDRLFRSIGKTWMTSSGCGEKDGDKVVSVASSTQDVKELIPEFYYLPEFLENNNGYNLGEDDTGNTINNVILPPWAKGSTQEFIRLHRLALESPYVSKNLHHWIDLVFGFKQRGRYAEEACNVFYYLTYEGTIDLETIDDPNLRKAYVNQIHEFGQTPVQLFKSSHQIKNCKDYKYEETFTKHHKPIVYTLSSPKNHHDPTTARDSGDEIRVVKSYMYSLLPSLRTPIFSATTRDISGLVLDYESVGCTMIHGDRTLAFNKYSTPLLPRCSKFLSWKYLDGCLRIFTIGSAEGGFGESRLHSIVDLNFSGPIASCVSSPDGRTIFTCTLTRPTIDIWQLDLNQKAKGPRKTIQQIGSLVSPLHVRRVKYFATSPTFNVLVSICMGSRILLWDIGKMKLMRELKLGIDNDNLLSTIQKYYNSSQIETVHTIGIDDISGSIYISAGINLYQFDINGFALASNDDTICAVDQDHEESWQPNDFTESNISCTYASSMDSILGSLIFTGHKNGEIRIWSTDFYKELPKDTNKLHSIKMLARILEKSNNDEKYEVTAISLKERDKDGNLFLVVGNAKGSLKCWEIGHLLINNKR